MYRCAHCLGKHHTAREGRFCAHLKQKPQPVAANVKAAPPEDPWKFKTPRAMVENMQIGRYAVAPYGGDDPKNDFVFIRVVRPITGKKSGQIILQTQHSDAYKMRLIIYPSGQLTFFTHVDDRLDRAVMMVAADPYTATMKYAEILDVCCRCGKTLTDNRSRWYGIGPECEKHFPDVINYINETKGAF